MEAFAAFIRFWDGFVDWICNHVVEQCGHVCGIKSMFWDI